MFVLVTRRCRAAIHGGGLVFEILWESEARGRLRGIPWWAALKVMGPVISHAHTHPCTRHGDLLVFKSWVENRKRSAGWFDWRHALNETIRNDRSLLFFPRQSLWFLRKSLCPASHARGPIYPPCFMRVMAATAQVRCKDKLIYGGPLALSLQPSEQKYNGI